MPILHPTTGRAVYGLGTLSVDGSVLPPLVGVSANGCHWLTPTVVVYQQYSVGATIEATDTVSLVRTTLDPQGAFFVGAGNGVWAAQLSGVRTNVAGLGPFPGSMLFRFASAPASPSVSESGQVAIFVNPATSSGIDIYDSTGALQLSLPVTLTSATVYLRYDTLAYLDAAGWHLVSVPSGNPIAFTPRANVLFVIPVVLNGETWLLEYESGIDQLSVRNIATGAGWIIPTVGQEFYPDIRPFGSVLRVAYSLTAAENPDDLVVLDINVLDGTTQKGTVVGGVVVFAAGPTLVGQNFGGITPSYMLPPIKHPVVDVKTGDRITRPWEAWATRVSKGVQAQGATINAIVGGSTTGGGGGGSTAVDLTHLDASWLVSGTVPQARKWLETTITTTGTQNDVSITAAAGVQADSLRADNAAPLTITGIAAGVPGQRLVIGAVGASDVTITNQDAGSVAANRIITGTGGPLTLVAGLDLLLLSYDGVTGRWRALSNDVAVDTNWIPLVDGSEPPNFITDGAGNLILVAYP